GKHGEIGALDDLHAESRRMLANPGEILVARARVDDRAEPRFLEKIDDEVVDDATLLVQHAAIERFARRFQLADIVGEKSLQEGSDARALEVDDAHMRDVEHTGAAADGMVLRDLRAVLQWHVPA